MYGPFIKAFADLNHFVDSNWPVTDAEFPPNLNQTLRFFIRAMHSRARAAFMLLQAGSYWESEIVLRSLNEAAVKCATFARRKNVDQLLNEFWVELQASSDRKAALRAAMAQKIIPQGSTDHPIFEALQDPDNFSVEPTANKQRRRSLDHHWSLPELVRKLQDESETVKPIIGLDSMLHRYGLQSEVLHVSAKYHDLLWDRMIRKDDLVPLENTHYCSQMSDALQMTAFCIVLSLEKLNVDGIKLREPIEIANTFTRLTAPYQDDFDRSQGFV
ncbi:MAG: hypothetical protein C0510_03275 [Erythrobacter sp.]|nr:hypothetical protein [Erythrobacter sp.]